MTLKPRSSRELAEKLGKWRAREFSAVQEHFGDSALFDGLFHVFCFGDSVEDSLAAQKMAGELLLELDPKCPISAPELLARSMTQWDRSAEELPFYALRQFGKEVLLAAIADMEADTTKSEAGRDKLETWRYWLKGDSTPEQSN